MDKKGKHKKDASARRDAATSIPQLSADHCARRGPAVYVVALIVGILAFAAFYPALSAEFVNFDDGKLLQQNDGYQGLSSDHLSWMFSTTYMGHYQPLTWLSYAVDYKLFGLSAGAYHRTNIILHALNAVLVYFLALRLFGVAWRSNERDSGGESARTPDKSGFHSVRDSGENWRFQIAAALAALLFAIHPLRVESVAWVSERRDVLSVFFLLAAAIAFLKSVTPGDARLRSLFWYAASLILLTLSLLSKAWGMSFFVIVILLNVYPLGRLPWRIQSWLDRRFSPVWLQTIPFLILGVIAAVAAANAQSSAYETMKTLDEWSITDRVMQACYGLMFYLRKTIWPVGLAVLYPLPADLNPLEPRFLLSAAGVVLCAVMIWLLRRKMPAIVIASLAYAVWLAPVLGFAQSGPQLAADRYSYVACIGWMIVLAGALGWLWHCRTNRATLIATGVPAVAVLIALFSATIEQSRVWKDSRSLWEHAVSIGADSTIAHRNRAVDLSTQGDVEGAIRHYQKALSIDPTDGSAWYLLANALKSQGRFDEAEHAYENAIEHLVQKHLAWRDLGEMYYNDLNRPDDAIQAFRTGIDYMQNLKIMQPAPAPHLYLYLGSALRARGDFANARPALEAALKFKNTEKRAQEELASMEGG